MATRSVVAFAPGRVNLIGEHTDYNGGLALPFAIGLGVRVTASPIPGTGVEAEAHDLGERDRFAPEGPGRTGGWKGLVRGMAASLTAAGHPVGGVRLHIAGDLPRNAGLASSAALTVATGLALLASTEAPDGDALALARAASQVEHEWLGARTGLLDQLAVLEGGAGCALRIDFSTLAREPVPLALGDWHLALLNSGRPHDNALGRYNERRLECERASRELGVGLLREATLASAQSLPAPLDLRVRHVVSENRRVDAMVDALRRGDLTEAAALLDAGHASLRDHFEVSTPEVERMVARAKAAGALGCRLVGGGFGGHVLCLFGPGVPVPADALEVRPQAGARLL